MLPAENLRLYAAFRLPSESQPQSVYALFHHQRRMKLHRRFTQPRLQLLRECGSTSSVNYALQRLIQEPLRPRTSIAKKKKASLVPFYNVLCEEAMTWRPGAAAEKAITSSVANNDGMNIYLSLRDHPLGRFK